MARVRGAWINLLGGIVGALLFGMGVLELLGGFSFGATFLAVFGFLLMSWAALDYRRFLRGTPESEVGGGRTIE